MDGLLSRLQVGQRCQIGAGVTDHPVAVPLADSSGCGKQPLVARFMARKATRQPRQRWPDRPRRYPRCCPAHPEPDRRQRHSAQRLPRLAPWGRTAEQQSQEPACKKFCREAGCQTCEGPACRLFAVPRSVEARSCWQLEPPDRASGPDSTSKSQLPVRHNRPGRSSDNRVRTAWGDENLYLPSLPRSSDCPRA